MTSQEETVKLEELGNAAQQQQVDEKPAQENTNEPNQNANTAQQAEEEQHENIIWHAIKMVGWGIYKVAYHSGEFLADLFGITTPRYQYVLTEYYERERRKAMQERIANGEIDEDGNEIPVKPGTA